MLQDHRTSLNPCNRGRGGRVRGGAEQGGQGGRRGRKSRKGHGLQALAGKPCRAEARATHRGMRGGGAETDCPPSPWQVNPDAQPRCLAALATCKSIEQVKGPRLEGEKKSFRKNKTSRKTIII